MDFGEVGSAGSIHVDDRLCAPMSATRAFLRRSSRWRRVSDGRLAAGRLWVEQTASFARSGLSMTYLSGVTRPPVAAGLNRRMKEAEMSNSTSGGETLVTVERGDCAAMDGSQTFS
jgi:hypothetical protein